MPKIVLVDPRGWQGAVEGKIPYPNIGIAYLVPVLQKEGYEVMIMDLNNEHFTDSGFIETVKEYRPDIIGFSVKTATMKSARSLGTMVKSSMPVMPVIVGGPHTAIAWRELAEEVWTDAILIGEGEETMPLLCSRLLSGESIEDIPAVVGKSKIAENLISGRAAINDLDNLLFPQYNLYPPVIGKYLSNHYPLVTSRGCVYKCTYCSVPLISGRKLRKRSPENVIEELKSAKNKYGVKAFEIIDDVFNFDIVRCKTICEVLIKNTLGLRWACPNGLRADRIDRELAQLMFKSGCRSVMVGVESADPDVLAAAKKGEKIEDIERGIRIFKDAGISVGGYFIIGLPGDSYKSQKLSMEFARKMGITAHFNMLVPYKGTELWEWAKTNARFIHDVENGLHFADSSNKVIPVFETDYFPASERQRAYEMVHTCLGQFSKLIPNNVSRWEYFMKAICLLWLYDRMRLPGYIFGRIAGKIISMLSGGHDIDFKEETKG